MSNNAFEGFAPISERVMVLQQNTSHSRLNLIQIYASTTDGNEEEAETFYHQLKEALKIAEHTDITIIKGDFNTKIGKDVPVGMLGIMV